MHHEGARASRPEHGELRDRICVWILAGEVVVDGELSLTEIATRSGAPNDEIRLALDQLTDEGVVELTADFAARVRVPTRDALAEVDAVRRELEALAVRRFLEHASAEQRAALEDAARAFRELAVDGAGPACLLRARDRFYHALLRGAGGTNTIALLADLRVDIALVIRAGLLEHERALAMAGELETVAAAVSRGDLAAAVAAVEEHVTRSSEAAARAIGLPA
ncbi:GntR family transcriptional regulator [Pseudonocardia lutea]|uniref:GntR family transcriptional regulator n=1 Tax=Pseudonocardia lutea TaxID=2172015 RepID=A0ABW1I1P4_9PSEU